MILTDKLKRNIKTIENVVFVFSFVFVTYTLFSTYWANIYSSINGKGYGGAIVGAVRNHEYYKIVGIVVTFLNFFCIFWEILAFIFQLLKQDRSHESGYSKYKSIFKRVCINYKPSFLGFFLNNQILPKLFVLNVFWIWLPHIQKIALFTVNLEWYSWIYSILCWEFASWLFHFASHRVRFLWCLHSSHHAPSELNMTVNWIHFFAEGFYSTLVLLVISILLGVNPLMFSAILAVDVAWSFFIHISESTLKNGKFGVFEHFIITPSHHRVHHAKNPLYIDTNFSFIFPVWDWIFGTLQPLKDEVKVEYGITRDLDVTNFADLYFGEIVLLYIDIKNTTGIKNKLLYVVMPPGWTPTCKSQTAKALRSDFLKTNPGLGATSRSRLLHALNHTKNYEPAKQTGGVPELTLPDPIRS